MRRLRIEHHTSYAYAGTVAFGPHRLLVRPREGHDIRVAASSLRISPPGVVKWHRDVNGNSVAVVTFAEPSDRLAIESEVEVEHYEDAPLDFLVDDEAVNYPFRYAPDERIELFPYQLTAHARAHPQIESWLARFWRPGDVVETYVLLDRMNRRIAAESVYRRREEPGVQSPDETLATGGGSCRDLATLFIEACRHLGLAARFVSGYLHAPATAPTHGATHAWSEVYLPGAGWKGFDSTTGELAGADHIATAVSRDPEAVPPVSGSFTGDAGAAPPSMEVGVGVRVVEP